MSVNVRKTIYTSATNEKDLYENETRIFWFGAPEGLTHNEQSLSLEMEELPVQNKI